MTAAVLRLQSWWRQREPRERRMLGLMVLALAAFVLWYAVLVPLRQARASAQVRYERAALALVQTELQLAQLRTLDQRELAPPEDAAALKQTVMAAAQATGLAVSRERERDQDSGGFGIEVDAASPQQLFAWLDALRQAHGLAPSTLSVAKREGMLRVQAEFDPVE
ncbi:type II secretion system protein GspM [Luteimonas deserti]|uniref:Type II secretion system protein M n=1 Tax=Luteimonas deserti TaxID=2752306 RepID=A0A7Z0QU59_9GAMM|nr:type II secretion system protein GspM [Luteimonas deserti]NYZ63902.1 type II secretion system protein M [Luteimonas deserti]